MALTRADITTEPSDTGPAADGGPRTVRALDPSEVDWAALRRVYPESDGQPMSDNTRQFRWIQTIAGGLQALFRDRPDVFVGGDLLWYPVEGAPQIRLAPDALVVFGRPPGDRGSYLQWLEGGLPPQVVFEVLSPQNSARQMEDKRRFYERYGGEEFYEYDPDRGRLRGWQRQGEALVPIVPMEGWVSPRLGIRFGLEGGELRLSRPDGQLFVSYAEMDELREQERRRGEAEQQRADVERQRAERLVAQLRALGIEPEAE